MGTYAIVPAAVDANPPKLGNYAVTLVNGTLRVTQKPATATYTGQYYVATASTSATTANMTLSAIIHDTSGTGSYGDITKAKVTFVLRNGTTSTPINTTPLTPTLLDLADSKTGTVTYTWNNVSIGSYTVGIVVGFNGTSDGDYADNDPNENTAVEVAQFKTGSTNGGGFIVNTNTSGLYPGDPNEKTNYGFSVRTGTPLSGNFNVVIRSGPKVYQFTSSTPTSLTFPATMSPDTGIRSAFEANGVFQDITDTKNPIVLDGSAKVQVATHDRGEPGRNDSIQITVRDYNGAVLFSSNSGEQTIGGGNIQNKVGEQAVGVPAVATTVPATLTPEMLQPIVAEAIHRWQIAGIDPKQLGALRQVRVQVDDLGGSNLGDAAPGVITISPNAAGFGWFVDLTPGDDSEYAPSAVSSPAKGHMDLLSVVAHELGHELGFADDNGDDVMNEALPAGVRHVPLPRAMLATTIMPARMLAASRSLVPDSGPSARLDGSILHDLALEQMTLTGLPLGQHLRE